MKVNSGLWGHQIPWVPRTLSVISKVCRSQVVPWTSHPMERSMPGGGLNWSPQKIRDQSRIVLDIQPHSEPKQTMGILHRLVLSSQFSKTCKSIYPVLLTLHLFLSPPKSRFDLLGVFFNFVQAIPSSINDLTFPPSPSLANPSLHAETCSSSRPPPLGHLP